MRILIITPLYPPDLGGLPVYVKQLAARLSGQREVTIVTYGAFPEQLSDVRIVCTSKDLPTLIRLPLFTARLWREARRADLLYVSDGASVGLPALLVGRLRQIPLIRFFLDDEARERSERALYAGIPEGTFAFMKAPDKKICGIRALQNWILRRTTHTLVPSSFLKGILERAYRIPSSLMTVAAFPIEQAFHLPFSRDPHPQQLFTNAVLDRFSGVEDIIKVLPELKKHFPNIRLVISNTGPDRSRLKAHVHDLGLASTVQFLGPISRAEFWYLLQTSSIFLANQTSSTSAEEIYQAYAAQIPVIASATTCHQEALLDRVSGLLVEPNDPSSLLKGISQLLEDSTLCSAMVTGGKQLLQKRGSWDEHIRQILSLV